jgi:hypothetical protein
MTAHLFALAPHDPLPVPQAQEQQHHREHKENHGSASATSGLAVASLIHTAAHVPQ